MEFANLNDGKSKAPMLGLGCYQASDNEVVQAVQNALDVGYRHIDTANFYENELYVGKGIRASKVDRTDLFVVSKIWPTSFRQPEKAIEYSLKAMDIGYIDVYLLHWPGVDVKLRYRAWESLIKYREKGYFKNIGVSNFKQEHLNDLIQKFGIIPAMNQIEISPWCQKKTVYKYCKQKGIVITACVPFARGNILTDPVLQDIATKYGKSVGQIVLRWNIQRGNCVIPKSSHRERISQNFNIFDFSLEEEDMERISLLEDENAPCYVSDSSAFTGDFWNIEDHLLG